ncbi:MAG: RNA polymerase sigma factor [Anaerolineae bacterium]|nr:RNA polymerase sigma factor [Anaerolineae bacterium]
MEERHAIARLRRGDISGLEPLVRQYQIKALRTVVLITRDHAAAEDIVQAAFVRVHERIHQYDPERPFAPWFFKSLIHDALKADSKQRRYVSLEAERSPAQMSFEDVLPAASADPAEEFEREELRQQIWDAIGKLTPKQRAAIVMRYYLAFSEAEIAEALDVASGTVKWRLHGARERLRGLLWRVRPAETPAHGTEVKRDG